MGKMKKKIFLILIFGLILLFFIYNELIIYGIRQGVGQLKIIINAEPIEVLIQKPEFPDSMKQKLLYIQEVRSFAVDSLGINDTDNYTTYYDQEGKPVLWVVTACKPFALEPKEWTFPVLGSFSYKGYFDKDLAEAAAEQLKSEGWDTGVRTVSGWSTLGWFKDPILSEMLNRNEGQLAELIIHELTHATIYVKDSVNFNENLASFIGELGAVKFLESWFGESSPELIHYVNQEKDRNRFISYILTATIQLDSLYQGFNEEMPEAEKEKSKEMLINQIRSNLDTVSFSNESTYRGFFDDYVPNNTFFMSYMRYHSKIDELKDLFYIKFDGDFERFLSYYKEKYPSL